MKLVAGLDSVGHGNVLAGLSYFVLPHGIVEIFGVAALGSVGHGGPCCFEQCAGFGVFGAVNEQ